MSLSSDEFINNVLDGADLSQQVEEMIKQKLQDSFESLMEAERTAFLEQDPTETNKGNGYYQRDWESRYGPVEGMKVPRDREGDFQTRLFEPYQRRDGWLEQLVMRMFAQGISTRDIAETLEKLYGRSYSAPTVSRITEIATEEIEEWQNRPLKKRYSVLYIDATVMKVRRDRVDDEALYTLAGVNEEGYRELLGFYLGGSESANVWRELLEDLKQRGLEEVLLVVSDDLPGLADQIRQAFPKADHQPCVVHKVRTTLNKVRQKHQEAIARDMKRIYKVPDREVARKYFRQFKEQWEDIYPELVESWEKDLDRLLTFLDYPESIQSVIYTTNWIERTQKKIKKRTDRMGSLPSPEAARKIVYIKAQEINEQWCKRRLRGFKKARSELKEMFEERYPDSSDTT